MILILDFGSQFTQLIARRMRELGVYCEITSFQHAKQTLHKLHNSNHKVNGIVLAGSHHSVYEEGAPSIDKAILTNGIPILGICYGLQLINTLFGGVVQSAAAREYGSENIFATENLTESSILYRIRTTLQTKKGNTVWMSHGDEISQLAPEFVTDARSSHNSIASMRHKNLPIYGVQFHPEVEHTQGGKELLAHFIFHICKETPEWNSDSIRQTAEKHLNETLSKASDKAHILCALSGGVDSTVAAVLTQKLVGKRLHCFFVDHGLLRHQEVHEVTKQLLELNLNVEVIQAKDIFLPRLKGISDPEQKRKIIGNTFIEVFEQAAKKIPNIEFLLQGTLYTDVIESVSLHGNSQVIKTHHNVGGLPSHMKLKILEPLRSFFKDEVRILGTALNIPTTILKRHPFPGPGLALRVLGEITEERVEIARKADAVLIEELKSHGLYDKVWQAFAVLLPVKSVGVMGDGRTYENACVLRCVQATDGMTAEWSPLPHEFLNKVSSRVVSEVRGINRVVYDITSKPPGTIEWE